MLRLYALKRNFTHNVMDHHLDSPHTIEELDQWAVQHSLSHDIAVNLRWMELLCSNIPLQTGNGSPEVSYNTKLSTTKII